MQLEPLYAAALASACIAGLPSFTVAQAPRERRLVCVQPDWLGTTLSPYAAVPTRKHLPTRSRAFAEFLVEAFGGEDRDPWLDSCESASGRH